MGEYTDRQKSQHDLIMVLNAVRKKYGWKRPKQFKEGK